MKTDTEEPNPATEAKHPAGGGLGAPLGSQISDTPEVAAELDSPSNLVIEGVQEVIPALLGRKLERECKELKRLLMDVIEAECHYADYIPEWEPKARRLCGMVDSVKPAIFVRGDAEYCSECGGYIRLICDAFGHQKCTNGCISANDLRSPTPPQVSPENEKGVNAAELGAAPCSPIEF